jgi:hypothetical protein
VGGVLALMGNVAPLTGLAAEIGEERPRAPVAAPARPAALLLTHAFLKFVWANRVFGYASVTMGAVPLRARPPRALPRAMRAAELIIRAALNFNRGLRSMYFALASLAWLAGPLGADRGEPPRGGVPGAARVHLRCRGTSWRRSQGAPPPPPAEAPPGHLGPEKGSNPFLTNSLHSASTVQAGMPTTVLGKGRPPAPHGDRGSPTRLARVLSLAPISQG